MGKTLEIQEHLPALHSLHTYQYEGDQYYSADEIVGSFFKKEKNQKICNIIERSYGKHITINNCQQQEIGFPKVKKSAILLSLAAVIGTLLKLSKKDHHDLLIQHLFQTHPNHNSDHYDTRMDDDELFDNSMEEIFNQPQVEDQDEAFNQLVADAASYFVDENSNENDDDIYENNIIVEASDIINDASQQHELNTTSQDYSQTIDSMEKANTNPNLSQQWNDQWNASQNCIQYSGLKYVEPFILADQTCETYLSQFALWNYFKPQQQSQPQQFPTQPICSQQYNIEQWKNCYTTDTALQSNTCDSFNHSQAQSDNDQQVELKYWECACCKHQKVQACPHKYPGIQSNQDNYNRGAKDRAKEIVSIFEKMLGNLGHDVHAWLECYLQTDEGIKTVIQELEQNIRYSHRYQKLKEYLIEKKDVTIVQYWRDNNLISDVTYHNLRKEVNLMTLLPTRKEMTTSKQSLNEQVEKTFKLRCPSSNYIGYIIDLDQAIFYILKLCMSLGKKLPKKIFFKIGVDGREINGVKQVAVALVPLNLRDVFPSQAVYSVFYIGLFQMKETKESIKETIGTLHDEIERVLQKQYFGKHQVCLFYVSDMHNVGMTFSFDLCPYCMAQTIVDFASTPRDSLDGQLPFSPSQTILCALHIKQRLVENVIGYMASTTYKYEIQKNIQTLHGLETFNWKEFHERVSNYGISQTSARSSIKSCMLSGDHCNTILQNIEKVVDNIEPSTKQKYLQILKLLRNIIIIIEMHQDNENNDNVLTANKIVELDKLIMQFLVACFSIWTQGIKAHYFHFIIHVPSIMSSLFKEKLSLSILSNQGFERSHLFHHAVFNRIINNGGGRTQIHPTKQLLLWQCRKVLVAIDLKEKTGETYWHEKRLKKLYSWDASHVKPQKELYQWYDASLVDPTIITDRDNLNMMIQKIQENDKENRKKQTSKDTDTNAFAGRVTATMSHKKRKGCPSNDE
ncbi:hypothetical protein C9374_013419 [Naegleria lovaniensis]|uniref:Uncharacterized protein n=1 Tax=Naegleria lovaniensis TaxID=51637 RepID=A0AA88GWP7_NAELO|nr:uncharacterized protein C9374_013831 [Naegleria lovaniensis]XP_044553828.1 uncharacterized protein C9374_013419 [Naegleria lovaniensis]KAG2370827.1 hypothetical protein C9374_013831 [Naegleria lovaniensis]KAG2391934.1 hypothetical protein C9374_013419 [Naegleria lovaniensis]